MFPAARIGDPITHDMLVPSGIIGPPAPAPCPMCAAQPVIIEGLPAAHVMCSAVCSGVVSGGIVHPPVPGPPPPIIKGSLTVFIHNMPAARWSPAPDLGACGVFLGDPKLSAMRTVLIGDVGMGGAGSAPGQPPVPIAGIKRTQDSVLELGWVEGSLGSPDNPAGQISFQGAALTVEGKLEGAATRSGAGGEARLGAAVISGSLTHSASDTLGTKSVTLAGSGPSAEAHASGFIGKHGSKIGIGGSASATASVVSGSVSGSREFRIPFTNKSIEFAVGVGGSAKSAGAGASGHAYYDTETQRAHAGIGGELAVLLVGVDIELGISFGKAKSP